MQSIFRRWLFPPVILYSCFTGVFAQSYNDGPIQLQVRVRDVNTQIGATDASILGVGFSPDEMTYHFWAQDNGNFDGQGWTGGQCLQQNFNPPGASTDFNTVIFNHTYSGATVPQFFDLRADIWEDDAGSDFACGGGRCNFDPSTCCGAIVFGVCVGVTQEDDNRCNANPFATGLDYRLGPPCQWYNHGYVAGACGGSYQPRIESFWRYTRGTDCNNPLMLGALPSGGSLTHFNSNECYSNNFSASPGRDVFYEFTISAPTGINISLCGGTAFNTVLFLLDASCNQIATNDNFCGIVSQISTNICSPGTYKVVVDGALANSAGTFTLLITDDPSALISVTVSGTDVTCNGLNDGTATANVTNGTAPFTYVWNPNAGSTQTVTGLSPGSYSVTVTDFTGCTASGSVTISEPAGLSFTTTVIPPTCNGGTNGSITVNATGGTMPYVYSGDGGNIFQNSNVLSGLGGGTYTVVVKDANNCLAQNPVTINAPAAILPNVTKTDISCNGANDGSVTANPQNGTPPYTYSLDNGPFVATSTFSGIGISGLHTLTVRDANGCTATEPFLISEPSILSGVVNSVIPLTCNGSGDGSFVISGTGGVAPYEYSLDDITYQPTGSFSGLDAGNYNVYIRDSNGCKDITPVTVNQPAVLNVTVLFQINISCNGSTNGVVVLTATGGTSPYEFSDDHFFYQPSGYFDRLPGGTYTYYVRDANNCEDSITFTIFEPDTLTLTIGSVTNASCLGVSDGSITLHPGGGTPPYKFSINGGAFQNDSVFTGLSAGDYDFTVRDDNFCELTQSLTIGFTTTILTSITKSNITCYGDSSGSISIIASNGQAPYLYSINGGAFVPQNVFSGLTAGQYVITVKDDNGCLAIDTVTISEPGPLQITLLQSSPAKCFNTADGSVDIDVTGGDAPYSYIWSNGSTSQNLVNVAGGNYTVTVTDASNCSDSLNVFVASTPPIFIDIESIRDVSCNGKGDASINVTVNGGTPGYIYLWSNGNNTEDLVDIGPGSYRLTVADANNCSQTETYTITSPLGLVVTIESVDNATCVDGDDGSITVSATGGTAPYEYSIDGFSFQSSAVFDGLSAGVYPVVVRDDNACIEAASVTVEDGGAIFYSYGNDKEIINGQSIPLEPILIPDIDTSEIQVVWEPAEGLSCDNCLSPVANPTVTTVYTATLTDGNGCVAKAVMRIVVKDEWQIFLPNIFTPNNDGNNDNFDYEGYGISNVAVRIFNRYGGEVYYNPSQPKGKGMGWNGIYNGKEAQQGAYVYLVTVLFTNNEERQKTGTITLVR